MLPISLIMNGLFFHIDAIPAYTLCSYNLQKHRMRVPTLSCSSLIFSESLCRKRGINVKTIFMITCPFLKVPLSITCSLSQFEASICSNNNGITKCESFCVMLTQTAHSSQLGRFRTYINLRLI